MDNAFKPSSPFPTDGEGASRTFANAVFATSNSPSTTASPDMRHPTHPPSQNASEIGIQDRIEANGLPQGIAQPNQQSRPSTKPTDFRSIKDLDIRDRPTLDEIPGMYRLLDLISEQGSGGTVDKIIIDQGSLREFVNTVSPGAYQSMTRVDFKILDNLTLRPTGLYGPKRDIVDLLQKMQVISSDMATKLLSSKPELGLRSGLYLLRPSDSSTDMFVIYWPEDATWNDNCVSSIRRNRITFMRYLSKVSHQTVCLVPPEHAAAIVWKDDVIPEYTANTDDDDDFDRMFNFEVAKSNQRDENVGMRPGFQLEDQSIALQDTEDLPEDIRPERVKPRLILGETRQAFVTVAYKPSSESTTYIKDESYAPKRLENELNLARRIAIEQHADEDTITLLCAHGLQKLYPDEVAAYIARKKSLVKESDAWKKEHLDAIKKERLSETEMEAMAQRALLNSIVDKYPVLDPAKLAPPAKAIPEPVDRPISSNIPSNSDNPKREDEYFVSLLAVHPELKKAFNQVELKLESITDHRLNSLKKRLVGTRDFFERRPELSSQERTAFIDTVLNAKHLHEAFSTPEQSGILNRIGSSIVASVWGGSSQAHVLEQLNRLVDAVPARVFVCTLDDYLAIDSRLERFVDEARDLVYQHFQRILAQHGKLLAHTALKSIVEKNNLSVIREASTRHHAAQHQSRAQLVKDINAANEGHPCHVYITSVHERKKHFNDATLLVNGHHKIRDDAALRYTLHSLQLSQEDKQNLQINPLFIPSPHLTERFNHQFDLPVGQRVLHLQIVGEEKFIVVVEDSHTVSVYLELGQYLQNAIRSGRSKKVIHKGKIGDEDLLFAFDQQKRMFLVCAPNKLQLHLFKFDESAGLQGWSNALMLAAYYPPDVSIIHACFVLNNDEIFLVDSTQQARIYSLVAQQFRPATMSLNTIPQAVCTSPDGSCLFISQVDEDTQSTLVYAYHWSAFGSGEPFIHKLPFVSSGPLLLTSFAKRSAIHLVGLDVENRKIRSFALDIATKVTEFQFTEEGGRRVDTHQQQTSHNCLIDCHADVWTRFPVKAAIPNHVDTVTEQRKSFVFATDRDFDKYAPHFANLVQTFQQTTRKPTEGALAQIAVHAVHNMKLLDILGSHPVSEFRLGSWLVSFLCLIPIHVAVTRENRFLPLKDGVISPEWEKELLGAEVGKIVDSVSLGWYESIFQSYMSQLPVKVVSSMGEQSVGKSYTLNHLVDSSFAGSAMRTTEGVWLSCTPTKDALIVALDFEGVHSIERSAQEDTLLVLFNTAISNLVLFRNNFAMSRDITGLFQSFQSSSTVLNPAANPDLFQSRLLIIIKDVVDSDTNEIRKEFQLKFQKIVAEEQEANFITCLHRGKISIVPWPVIESENFYKLFGSIRKTLDAQVVTHPAGGQFLLTMKTLMAKLKANDWASISQTLVAHRAQKLLSILPTALMFGLAEVEPQEEPLKNFDTDELIGDPDDHMPFLWLKSPGARETQEHTLSSLCRSWSKFSLRDEMPGGEWINGLSAYLQHLVELRGSLVRAWIESNLARFTATHASIDDLWREFEKLLVEMKTNVELCRMKCANCNLQCMDNRLHDANAAHNCQTNHACTRKCDYVDIHAAVPEDKVCGYPAGHAGPHICAVERHLCGAPCKLQDKGGCLGECTKVVAHEGEHLCPSNSHACGLPCSLQSKHYTCTGSCTVSSDEPHIVHICENRLCPMACILCKRLCSSSDHLHALEPGVDHLCGQEHSCAATCASPGSCEIETAPQSIKAVFTGRHETFEYTKYTQVAKRLKCAIVIPPGETSHQGSHVHTTDPTRVHFCKSQCEKCGYYCTLPLGHPQQQHDTSHGSMSRTQWVVDGPAGTTLDVNGHKYGSEDDGAPMMCNLVCTNLGRHAHLDFCRTQDGPCSGPEISHIVGQRLSPEPARGKDWIAHSLFWKRSGFKDPYSKDEQANFAKCDAMCSGPEHNATTNAAAQPSFCVLPIFHPPETTNAKVGLGYRSHDGHVFLCKNPVVLQQAFHVIFVIDRSGSMTGRDRLPLAGTPVTAQIQRVANNRLGAVYSALYGFWVSRHAATSGTNAQAGRRDAYSVILFQSSASTILENDFTTDPNGLLNNMLRFNSGGGTNFHGALEEAKRVMVKHWSTERTPVVIFLSDGEDSLADNSVRDIGRTAIARGKPLSLHTVSFGRQTDVLRRMANVALDVQNGAPANIAGAGRLDSTFSEALDSVQLANSFLAIADSLRKPRGALMQT